MLKGDFFAKFLQPDNTYNFYFYFYFFIGIKIKVGDFIIKIKNNNKNKKKSQKFFEKSRGNLLKIIFILYFL